MAHYVRIAILNGPNLNLLGRREPSIYGTESMEHVLQRLRAQFPEVYFDYRQSNHEGDLIDWIQQITLLPTEWTGVVLNAGGYTHTSVALRDAVAIAQIPIVEVHISDITQREPFRSVSLLTDVCQHTIFGIGIRCYQEAAQWIIKHA